MYFARNNAFSTYQKRLRKDYTLCMPKLKGKNQLNEQCVIRCVDIQVYVIVSP